MTATRRSPYDLEARHAEGVDADAPMDPGTLAAFVGDHTEEIVDTWRELVRWDPALPHGSTPAVASAVVTAVARALARPEPFGWGEDPEVEKVVEVFATASGSVEVAVGHLVSLREALRRALTAFAEPARSGAAGAAGQSAAVWRASVVNAFDDLDGRINMIIDRAIAHAAVVTTARLREDAMSDPETGLPNRRALERDLFREVSRAERYGRGLRVGVMRIPSEPATSPATVDLTESASESAAAIATALQRTIRAGDGAYMDGEQFVVILPEADDGVVPALVHRVESEGAVLAWGSAAFPADGTDPHGLLLLAEERCAQPD
jgi:GGDEF domain-containing protein